MDDLGCPRCKTTKYRNPSLKLMVNLCGHALCESCVDLLFIKGAAACPECGSALRRSNFRIQLFEDPVVEKETEIRKRILKDYCKRESDFPTLREYNDYLEEVETIIFNLVNNIDIVETNRRIEAYKKENKEQIVKDRSRPNEYLVELDDILFTERRRHDILRIESLKLEKMEKLRKAKNHEALIDDLMFSESDANSIVASHKVSTTNKSNNNNVNDLEDLIKEEELKLSGGDNPAGFTSGIGFSGARVAFLPLPKAEEVPLFEYTDLQLDFGALTPPTMEEIRTHPTYLKHIRGATPTEQAGGYHSSIACCRALQDAFCDIALQPKALRQSPHHSEPMDVE